MQEGDGRFLGLPVRAIADQATVDYDVLIVAVLERPAGTARLLRIAGVPDEKILMLQPAAAAVSETSAQGA